MKLDLEDVYPPDALEAIRSVGDLVRVTDAFDPLDAEYIFTAGAEGLFIPWTWRLRRRIRMLFWWWRPGR